LITKETWRELATEAESIILQQISDKTSKTEYFFSEIIGARKIQHEKKMLEKSQKDSTKFTRVQVNILLIF
jgi:hypothetical protein